ncbi:MAG: protein kinase, partial [Acidimicrobiia bacterium]
MSLYFQALGSLQAEGPEGPVDLGSRRQRALLARLLLDANAVVSTDRLLDDLWSDEAGTDHQSALWVYVSGLRSALEPDRAPRAEGTVLLTRPPGYVLAVEQGASDVDRFVRLLEEGRPLVETDPAQASSTLRDALGLWRGRAFEDFSYEPWAANEIDRLEALRLSAIELRLEADLRLGQGGPLVPELEALCRQHPLREGFLAQLMLALHRAGRTADALRTYSAFAARLGEELGLEPGRTIRSLEERIVMDDPELLSGPPRGDASRSGLAVRGYELRDVIGEGAFGVVHRAFHPSVGREVAVKAVRKEFADSPTFIRRFESEAQLIARLEHPHIVPLYDFWREPGAAFLVMRLMRGGSLADTIAEAALPPERAAVVFDQLADALATAHAAGVVHRDIKPSNVLLDGSGNAYLADFGVAVVEGITDSTDVERSLPGPYRAPEHVMAGEANPASDIYSLGVLAAQAITGFEGDYEAVRGALDGGVRAVLDRATAQRPEERFADPRQFANALGQALGFADDLEIPERVDVENPYKGLRAFGVGDAKDFFGRDRVVSRLVGRLDSPRSQSRFTVVVGPSGSGKSSVVRAGLLPAVRAGAIAGSEDWFIAGLTPGMHPFETLEEALLGIATSRPPS